MKYTVLGLLLIIGMDAYCCGSEDEFPYEVKSVIPGPLTADYCFPIEVFVPNEYEGQTLQRAFVRYYASPEKMNFSVYQTEDNEKSSFEAEIAINGTGVGGKSKLNM